MENKKKKIIFCLILFSTFCFLFSISSANAVSLYISPASGSYVIGQTFPIDVYVSSADQPINAASGVISFPQDKLEVVSLSKSGSIFILWVQEPSFSNSLGTFNFEGIILNPGFIGSAGKVLTANLKVKAGGNASLLFSSGSVLANDGKGTNILATMTGATYTLKPTVVAPPTEGMFPQEYTPAEEYTPSLGGTPAAPVISSASHPQADKWYSNNDPEFSWKLPADATGVSLMLTKKPASDPGNVSDGLIESKKFEDVEDGVWYFHIKFRNKYGWGGIIHRKVLVDTQPPKPFEINVDNGGDPTNPSPILRFETNDALSGIDYYEIKIGEEGSEKVPAENIKDKSYRINPQDPGKYTALIKAVDKAGNYTVATTDILIQPLEPPTIIDINQPLQVGDTLLVKGKSKYPNAVITFFVKKEGEEAMSDTVKTDSQGNWTYTYSKSLDKGIYQIWTQVIDNRLAKSQSTEKRTVAATTPALIRIGGLAIGYLAIAITIVVLIAALFAAIFRISLWKKRLRRETKKAERSVVNAFRALRSEVQEQIEFLDGKPGLTKEEISVRDRLKEALDISENFINKELEDIDKKLK